MQSDNLPTYVQPMLKKQKHQGIMLSSIPLPTTSDQEIEYEREENLQYTNHIAIDDNDLEAAENRILYNTETDGVFENITEKRDIYYKNYAIQFDFYPYFC